LKSLKDRAMQTYLIDGVKIAHNKLEITDHKVLNEFLLNELGESNDFDDEIKDFMFVHMSGTERTFELTGGHKGDKVIVSIFDKNGKIFETMSFPLENINKAILFDCETSKGVVATEILIDDREEKQKISDTLIEQIKQDILEGDTTVLDMILMKHSKKYLEGCLPEKELN